MESSQEPQLKTSLDVFKLIQPDLLTVQELTEVLLERGVVPSLLPQSKDKLLSLFKRIAYPLPQRECKQNHRGSLLMKQRKRLNRIRFNEPSTSSQPSFTIGVAGSSSIRPSKSVVEKPSTDRLKPPPDLINYERKTIKLSTSSNKLTTSSDLDKIIIKKRKTSESNSSPTLDKIASLEISKTPVEEQTEKNKQQKQDDESKSGSCLKQQSNGVASKPAPKRVTLKRNHLFTKPPSLPAEDTNDNPASEPEKKRKPITWP